MVLITGHKSEKNRRNLRLGGIFPRIFDFALVHFFRSVTEERIKRGRFLPSIKSNLLRFGFSIVARGSRGKQKAEAWLKLSFVFCTVCWTLHLCLFNDHAVEALSRWSLIQSHCAALSCSLCWVCVGGKHHAVALQSLSQKRVFAPIHSCIISVKLCNVSTKHICPVVIGSLHQPWSHIPFNQI